MKKLFYITLFIANAAFASPQPQKPNASACYNISHPDARTSCLARVHGDHSYCYNIQAPDWRAKCLSEAR